MKQQTYKQWPTIGFINRFFQAGILFLFLAALISLGEHLTGSI